MLEEEILKITEIIKENEKYLLRERISLMKELIKKGNYKAFERFTNIFEHAYMAALIESKNYCFKRARRESLNFLKERFSFLKMQLLAELNEEIDWPELPEEE